MRSPVTEACPAHGWDPQLRPSMLKGASAALAPNCSALAEPTDELGDTAICTAAHRAPLETSQDTEPLAQ